MLGNVCKNSLATLVLDGQTPDNLAGQAIATGLQSACPPGMSVTQVNASSAGTIFHPTTGQIWLRGAETLIIAGGPYFQKAIGWLESNSIAGVKFQLSLNNYEFVRTDNGLTLVSVPTGDVTATHDWFVIEVVREPVRGSFTLACYGFGASGTGAAAVYLLSHVMPAQGTFTDEWYLVEWQDTDANAGPSAGDTFTKLHSGKR
jgi:hypothetical protein